MTAAYAELQVTSNYSFLRGASHAAELALQAAALGHRAMAVTDRNTLAGVVRAHVAAKKANMPLVVGTRLVLEDGPDVLALPLDRAAYGRLARLLTLGKRRAAKGECRLGWRDLLEAGAGMVLLAVAPEDAVPPADFRTALGELARRFPGAAFLAASHLYRGGDAARLDRLAALAGAAGAPLVATNDVHYHHPDRRVLQDVVTCIREGCTIAEAGWRLHANAERHLKPAAEMARLFRHHPEAVARTVAIAARCRFSLDELRYEYPDESPEPQAELERLVHAGAAARWPGGVPAKAAATIAHELALIARLGYAAYFLTVYDIVRYARSEKILCQGRGSAANSVVCYCLGITAIDPIDMDLLFERFISQARNEPPDIDVDFEHERREEVIQYIYEKYGRERAGLAATHICYRARGAIREVGKAMGLSVDTVEALAGTVWGWSVEGIAEPHVRRAGLDPADPTLARTLELARALIGFPRHLSQHVGGFVITRGRLDEVVPIENAAMAERTVVEWDKDDLDALGILKVDVLALGMLTCIRKAFDLLRRHHGVDHDLASIPGGDRKVYEMLCRADSIGVFQVESRAQMTMLPRLRPRNFYDLVIEVAIVRPGPIQGDMVHPYLRRRDGKEPVEYPGPELRQVLEKTLGVPLFQEQAMRIAIVAAGFTPDEADGLRRAMATFRHAGVIHEFRDKLIDGMVANRYDRGFAERCYRQIEGFGNYGFPESHAASFALLVYVSAWVKCHYPAAFAAALINSQPMGFYAPAQLVRDARDHAVEIRPVDVNASGWDCTLEPGTGGPALRLGLRRVKGLAEAAGRTIVARRGAGYADPQALWRRTGLPAAVLERLADADAFGSIGLGRRPALWAVKRLKAPALPLFAAMEAAAAEHADEPAVSLPAMSLGAEVVEDYTALALSLKAHPMALLRPGLPPAGPRPWQRLVPARRLVEMPDRSRAAVAGLVLIRQRPGSAKGVIFLTLEDETGVANLVVWPPVFERLRPVVLGGRLVAASGRVQRQGTVVHLVVEDLGDWSDRLDRLSEEERTFTPPLARADEVKHPGRDIVEFPLASRDFR
ncbi:MAG: error-prone DNA polymerase [Alphaproteobacteria bacterium]|nr:error-prone DNA polymerase [Alphaproteobacteria bacterium]